MTSTSCFRQSSSENVYLFCASEGSATTGPGESDEASTGSKDHSGTVGGISKKDIVEEENKQGGLLTQLNSAHPVFLISMCIF